MLRSKYFQVLENAELHSLFSSASSSNSNTVILPVKDGCERINKSFMGFDLISPQKRSFSPDDSESNILNKRRKNSSLIHFDTPGKNRFKEIMKTPIDLLLRRKTIRNDKNFLNDSTSSMQSINDTFTQNLTTPTFDNTFVANELDHGFKNPSTINLMVTPRCKKKYKRKFKKTFTSTSSVLKNVNEMDPNCSVDDVDVSIFHSSKNFNGLHQAESSFCSLISTMETEESIRPKSRMSSYNAFPVLTSLFHYVYLKLLLKIFKLHLRLILIYNSC